MPCEHVIVGRNYNISSQLRALEGGMENYQEMTTLPG